MNGENAEFKNIVRMNFANADYTVTCKKFFCKLNLFCT